MTEAQKEYFRGFRDGARAANRDEFKQVIEQLMTGVTDVFKSVPDKLIENINITVDTSALEDCKAIERQNLELIEENRMLRERISKMQYLLDSAYRKEGNV